MIKQLPPTGHSIDIKDILLATIKRSYTNINFNEDKLTRVIFTSSGTAALTITLKALKSQNKDKKR